LTADPSELELVSAQLAFERMMRTEVAPALRRAGFTGTFRDFKLASGDNRGYINAQKSRHSTRAKVDFRIMIGAPPCIYEMQLFALMLEQERPKTAWWEVRAGQPTAAVAEAVLTAIRRYAIPAIRAALDDPGCERRTRTFPRLDDRAPDGLGVEPGAWYVQPEGTALDGRLASLTSDEPVDRLHAAMAIGQSAVGDPRAVAALLDRLEREPHQFTRRLIASVCLLPVAGDPEVRAALSETAEADEDVEVRWAARFALLFDPRAS
jgi:HEAT repeats